MRNELQSLTGDPRNKIRPARSAVARGLARAALAATLTFAVAGAAHAADGDPDPTFSADGIVQIGFAGGPTEDTKVAVDASGRVLVAATITRTGPNRDMAIARIRANGTIDTSFGFEGLRTVGFDLVENGTDSVLAVVPQADGKVLLLGRAEVADEIPARAPPAIARLTAAGNADPTFGTNGRLVVAGSPWTNPGLYFSQAMRQADGKLLFGGYCVNCPGTYRAVVVRLTATGELDPTFGTVGWSSMPLSVANPRFEAITVDDLGRIVMVGTSSSSGVYTAIAVRMTASGAADPSFGGGSGEVTITDLPSAYAGNAIARAVVTDRDHSMILAVSNYTALDVDITGLIRLNADGTRNWTWSGSGFRNLTLENGSRIYALAMRSDRRVLAAGSIDPEAGGKDMLLARILPTGFPDNGFDGNGLRRLTISASGADAAESMILAAGKPVLAGYAYSPEREIALVRMQSDQIFANGVD